MRPFLLYLILFVLFLTSCNLYKKKNTVSEKSNQIASIDSISINYDEVDNLCRQELFDQLSRIHLIRKITLEELIKDKIVQLEANKSNITVEQLTNSLYKNKVTSANLEKFAILTNHTEKVTELREALISYDTKSPKGQEILTIRYKEYLLNQFVDSLKKTHQITISLKPPKSPTVKLDNLIVHYKGNLNSAITFLVISDFDCHMCRESNAFFEKLYSEYKGKVRFGFTHYSSYVSNSAIASECASNQDKFWEMHDSIFNAKLIPDSVALFRMAKNLNLNMNTFDNDFKNKALSDKIHDNLLKLESAGIYGTPTIMINNQLVFNSTSLNEIEKMLKEEIAKAE
jgi:protein-disulfide isomerase